MRRECREGCDGGGACLAAQGNIYELGGAKLRFRCSPPVATRADTSNRDLYRGKLGICRRKREEGSLVIAKITEKG